MQKKNTKKVNEPKAEKILLEIDSEQRKNR